MSGGKATNLTCIWTFFPSKIFTEFLQGEIFVQEWVYSIGAVLLQKADIYLKSYEYMGMGCRPRKHKAGSHREKPLSLYSSHIYLES